MNDLYYRPGGMLEAAEKRWEFEQGEAIAKAERKMLKEREDYYRKRIEERKRSHNLIQNAEEAIRKRKEEFRLSLQPTFYRHKPPKRKSFKRKPTNPKPDTSWVTQPRLDKKQWELWGKELLHLIRKSNLFGIQSPSFTVNQHEIDAAERRPAYRQDARDKVWDGYRWEYI